MLCSFINLKVPVMTKQDLQTDDVIIVPQTLVQPEMLKKIGGNVQHYTVKKNLYLKHIVLLYTTSSN